MTNKIICFNAQNEFELTEMINSFNESRDSFATQIFQTKKGKWVAFVYYKSNGENKNGK